MSKDPAFLFYPGDWLGGTLGMTLQEKGAYMELLIYQFNNNTFTEAHAKRVLNVCFADVWHNIRHKFKTDGTYYWNERLNIEKERRANYCESRRQSALSGKTIPEKEPKHTQSIRKAYAKRMEDEDISSLITKDIQDNNIKGNKEDITIHPLQKKQNFNIPTLPEFLDFAKQVCTEAGLKYVDFLYTITAKFETWIDNGWKDGNGSKIKNWKLKFKNTLPYLKPVHKSAFEKKPKFYAYFEQYPQYFNPDGTPRIEN